MTQATLKKLQGMLNKSFRYGTATVTITGYEENEKGRVYIHTDVKDSHFDRPAEDIMSLLKQFEPVNANIANCLSPGNTGLVLFQSSSDTTNQLQKILMENIEKLKGDPAYINQAKAINNTVSNMINLQKTQIEFFKATREK